MSVQAQSWVIKYSQHKGSELLLMLMIANHAHADGTNAFPSTRLLAEECRMSTRQIRRLLRTLEASGELIVHRYEGRRHNYSIRMENEDRSPLPTNDEDICDKMTQPASDKMSPPTPDKMSRVPRTNSTKTPDIAMSLGEDIAMSSPLEPSLTVKEPSLKPRVRVRASSNASSFGEPLNKPKKIGEHTLAEYRELLDAAAPHLKGEHLEDVRKMWLSGAAPLELIKCYNVMRMEPWRTSRVTWRTVAAYLPDWRFRRDKGIEPGMEQKHGKKKIRTREDYEASRREWYRKYGYDLDALNRANAENGRDDQPDQPGKGIAGLLGS